MGIWEKKIQKMKFLFDRITHFGYNGHKYIKFQDCFGNGSVGGVVHDPDCECFKKEEIEK